MVWVCRKCHFMFTRVKEPERCPDCGKQFFIEEATPEEEKEFYKELEKSKMEKW